MCKHIIWTMMNVCRVPEGSDLLQQLFLTQEEAFTVIGNSYSQIPQKLMLVTKAKTRLEMIKELLEKDPRNNKEQR